MVVSRDDKFAGALRHVKPVISANKFRQNWFSPFTFFWFYKMTFHIPLLIIFLIGLLISVCSNAVRVISLKLKNPEVTSLKQIGQNMPRLLRVYHPRISLRAPISFTLSKARSLEEIGKHLEGICNIWGTSSSFCPLMLFFRFRIVWIFVSSLVLIVHIGNFMKPSFDI